MASDRTRRRASSTQPRKIDWASAEIEGGALAVELTGDAVKGWAKDLAGVLTLLEASNHRWGAVRISKNVITVSGVQEGAEQDLRHFLESVVLQVNSDLGLQGVDDAALDLALGTDGEDGGSDHVRKARDRHMAAAFRGFAASDS
jgi:hypothetical protein